MFKNDRDEYMGRLLKVKHERDLNKKSGVVKSCEDNKEEYKPFWKKYYVEFALLGFSSTYIFFILLPYYAFKLSGGRVKSIYDTFPFSAFGGWLVPVCLIYHIISPWAVFLAVYLYYVAYSVQKSENKKINLLGFLLLPLILFPFLVGVLEYGKILKWLLIA